MMHVTKNVRRIAAGLVALATGAFPIGAFAETFVIGIEQPASHTWAMAAEKFAEEVEARTNGEVTADVFTDAALGSQRETLEGMLTGTADGVVTLEPLSYWVPEISVWGTLCLFEDADHLSEFVWGPLGEEFNALAQPQGFRIVGNFLRGPREISSIRPVNSLADLEGMRIRVPQAPTSVKGFNALGAIATPIAFSEVYQALDQGVIDAQENPLDIIYAARLHEVTPNIALTHHQRQVAIMVLAEEKFQKLSPEHQEAVLAAAREAERHHNEVLFPKYMADIEAKLKEEGVTFTQPDQKEFCSAVADVHKTFEPAVAEWVERIQALRSE